MKINDLFIGGNEALSGCFTSKYQINPRLLSRITSECPLLPLLFGLMVGQLMGLACRIGDDKALYFLSIMAVVSISSAGWRSSLSGQFGLFLMVGLIQSLCSFRIYAPDLYENKSYLVKVVNQPRRPQPGGIRLNLEVLGEYKAWGRGFETIEFAAPPKYACKAIDLPWRNISLVRSGALLVVRASFKALKPHTTILSYDGKLQRDGFSGECLVRYATAPQERNSTVLEIVRDAILDRAGAILGNGERAGLFLSMALGFRDRISRTTEESFKRIGLSHLLVFSGYQVLVFYGSVVFILGLLVRVFFAISSRLWLGLSEVVSLKKLFTALGICISAFLVGVVGVEASSVRAIVAAAFLLVSLISERRLTLWNSIVTALLALSFIWPCSILDPGVELTFAALIGIALADSKEGHWLARYCKVALSVWLTTTPVVMIWFGNLSFLSVPANLIFAPLFTLFSCNLGLGGLLLNFIGLDPQGILLRLSADGLEYLNLLTRTLAKFPWVYLELKGSALVLSITMFLLVLASRIRRQLLNYIARENLW